MNIYTTEKYIAEKNDKVEEWQRKWNSINMWLILSYLMHFHIFQNIFPPCNIYILILLNMCMCTVTDWEKYDNKSIGHWSVWPVEKEKKKKTILDVLNNSRTARSSEILIPFLSFTDKLLKDTCIIFQKSVNNC